MIDRAPSPGRPTDLDAVQVNLVELALGGSIDPSDDERAWYEATAVARPTSDGRLIAHEDWLSSTLPAPSAEDLVRRTLLRDPLYRLHVDVLVTEVLMSIGGSARWRRLEDLLLGDLTPLAPRLASLLTLGQEQYAGLRDVPWRSFDLLPRDLTTRLDEHAWGTSTSPGALFPVLQRRYPELASVPVFLDLVDPVLASAIAAATTGQAIKAPDSIRTHLIGLCKKGAPLWWCPGSGNVLEVTLSAPCRASGPVEHEPAGPFRYGVPELARFGSRLVPTATRKEHVTLWEIAETPTTGLAFVGTCAGEPWPADDVAASRGLPRLQHLSDLVLARRSRRDSDPPDEALRALAAHPLFGFWLQALLVEALDRELGEDTLLFAPPTHAVVEDVEAATGVYYRPRILEGEPRRPARELGVLDPVLTRLAAAMGVQPVPLLGDGAGPWSAALALLARAGVAQTRHDRWALSTHTLDRLHGGGLMTAVLRRGKGFRERIHGALEVLWLERVDAFPEVRCA